MIDNYWYRVTVKINENFNPKFYYKEIYETDCIIHYILSEEVFRKQIEYCALWRFSRYQYDNDDCIMKFKFYTTEINFKMIKADIEKNKIIWQLKSSKMIKINIEKATESNDKVGSDRDNLWSYTVSEAWPYFINGLSRMWMEMIHTEKEKWLKENYTDLDINNLTLLIYVYEEIKNNVNLEWIKWGSHAVYHHANAVFGYLGVRFNVDETSLYYERRVNSNKIKKNEIWIKRSNKYKRWNKLIAFKNRFFKPKNKIGYINL